MDKLEHVSRHKVLHSELDELLADFLTHTDKLPSNTTVFELIVWSNKQCNIETID